MDWCRENLQNHGSSYDTMGGVQHVTVNSPSTSIDGTNFTHFTYQILSDPMNISTSTQCLELSTINRPPNSWDEKSADCCTKLRNSRICCSPEPGNPETLRDRVCLKIGLRALKMAIYIYLSIKNTSSTAQGGGGSFKNRKPIGEVGCCESGMAERSHCWSER